MSEIKISVRDLSKVFMRYQRTKVKGIATDGAAALKNLLKKMAKSNGRGSLPSKDDPNAFYALDDVSFDVKAGEVLGIIGRNGAGKSTLLKILARVLNPSAGRVEIRGRVMSMLELGVGFAPELTVSENIQIQGRLSGISPKNINEVEDNILNFAGLTQYRDSPLGACPSGSFAQLGFSAMLHFNVDIILADEVLAVGDARFRQLCEERVLAAGKSGESVLFVSHDMNAIRRVCSRVIWIDKGQIRLMGAPDDVIKAYTTELLAGNLLAIPSGELAASCRLIDLRLLDENRNPIGALHMTEDAYIDCLLRITRPDISVKVQMELWQGKHCIFTSESQRPISTNEEKTFQVSLKIPGNFLNELQYQVKCRLFVNNMIAAEEQLTFSVMNSMPNESVWADWAWGRSGLISPRLHWE